MRSSRGASGRSEEEKQPRMNTEPNPSRHKAAATSGGRAVQATLFSVLGLLLSAGCSLPQAQHDPTRFYVLSAISAPPPAAAANAPVVHLRQVDLASYLKARAIVVRKGDNEVEFREFARWGESIELGIARVLREELLARGAASSVLTAGLRSAVDDKDYTLNIRVLACEGTAGGGVIFRAVWDLTKGSAKQPVAGGDYRPGDLRWDGKSEGSLAAALSRAVAGLAEEVSAGLRK